MSLADSARAPGAPRAVYLALGSNLGERWRALGHAVDQLALHGEDLRVSPVYETAPVGGPAGQGPYLNCVVLLQSARSARAILEDAQAIEKQAGRVRRERWGARTLDVDILLIEGEELHEPDLEVPHPRLYERAFVLAPLADLDPSLVPADWPARVGESAVAGIRRVGQLLRSPDVHGQGRR